MNGPSPPNKPASHQHHQGVLPFSIDHILSSPVKQAAAVRAAAVAAVSQQHQGSDMLSSLIASNQDALSNAMFNEQFALLASQQQQQQHHHHHLLNPAALAAAAAAAASAGPPQQQQWQQQQLMAAAAANFGAIQTQNQTLNPLNPLLASQQNQSAQQNFLSYFMAYMLLQQQQQQTPQSHQLSQLQHQALQAQRSSLNSLGGAHIGNSITNLLNSGQYHAENTLKQFNKAKNSTFDASPMTAAAAAAPLPQLASPGRSGSPTSLNQAQTMNYSHQLNYNQKQRLSVSPQSSGSGGSNNRLRTESLNPSRESNRYASDHKRNLGNSTASSSAQSSSAIFGLSNGSSDTHSPALNSLSNFVSEALSPILDSQKESSMKLLKAARMSSDSIDRSFSSKRFSDDAPSRKSGSVEPESRKAMGLKSRNSAVINSGEGCNSNGKDDSPSTLDLISTCSQPPKSIGVSINTQLAKEPPELISKQPAWVFCTRYSDRPSSGKLDFDA